MKRRQATVLKQGKHARVICKVCSTTMRSDNLGRHLKMHNSPFPCHHCQKKIRSDKLLRHETLCRDNIDERICPRDEVDCLPDLDKSFFVIEENSKGSWQGQTHRRGDLILLDHPPPLWSEMGCETLLDYMEIYVLTDSLSLCDVFESFRDLCIDYYIYI